MRRPFQLPERDQLPELQLDLRILAAVVPVRHRRGVREVQGPDLMPQRNFSPIVPHQVRQGLLRSIGAQVPARHGAPSKEPARHGAPSKVPARHGAPTEIHVETGAALVSVAPLRGLAEPCMRFRSIRFSGLTSARGGLWTEAAQRGSALSAPTLLKGEPRGAFDCTLLMTSD